MARAPAVIAVLAALLAGCGSSPEDDAREAAEDYVASLGAADGAGTCAAMTRGLQRQFIAAVVRANPQARGESCPDLMAQALAVVSDDDLRRFSRAKIEDVRIDEDRGTFRYRLDRLTVPGKVAKEDDRWRVSCCIPGDGGASARGLG